MKVLFRNCLAAIIWSTGILYADTPAVLTVGQPVELTEAGTYYMAPAWAPQGGTIAVTGPHYNGIFLVDFPDGGMVQLSDDPAAGFGMAWNHDGTEIAARIASFADRRRLDAVAVFDAITGQKRMLTEFGSLMTGTPRWTRDDRQIYMSGTNQLQLLNLDGSLPKAADNIPAQRIIYARGNNIEARDAGTLTDVVVAAANERILNLTISPDGDKLAYEVMGGSLWVANIDGSQAVDLGAGDDPTWNPAGDKLAFAVTTDDGHRILSADIIVVNIDGSGRVNLTATPDDLEVQPDWSPDGRWIAYHTMNDGRILVQEVR
ncbi:MAG: PD40 domain-containing protein [Fidelibacterota bacterium]|nr:MAG: PD40 domain-containing protein [Candidatus Neomarinimicrobiota bacterium]